MPNATHREITRAVKLVRKLEHEIKRAGRTVDPAALATTKAAADELRDYLLALQAAAIRP